jgi:hypothetical protein
MFIINKIRASGGHIQLTREKKDIMYIFFNVGLKSLCYCCTHFDPLKWYVNDSRDYMGVQIIFGLFLQLNWKETTFVMSWKHIC